MMMDWVAPACRGAAAQSFEAVRQLPRAAGPGRPDRGLAEPAAVWHLIGLMMAPCSLSSGVTSAPGSAHAAASASSPSSDRMWQARRMILRASDKAARLPPLRSLTAA